MSYTQTVTQDEDSAQRLPIFPPIWLPFCHLPVCPLVVCFPAQAAQEPAEVINVTLPPTYPEDSAG